MVAQQPSRHCWHLIHETGRKSRIGRMQEQVEFCWSHTLDYSPIHGLRADASPQDWLHSITCKYILIVQWIETYLGQVKQALEQSPAYWLVLHQSRFQHVGWWLITLHYFVYCSMNSFVAGCGRICLFFLSPCVQVLSACQHSKLNCWWKDTDPTLEDELFQLLM